MPASPHQCGLFSACLGATVYTALPDWFLLFDVYERQSGRFWSSARRSALAAQCGLVTVPTLFRGQTTLAQLQTMLDTVPSRYRSGTLAGPKILSF